MIVDFHSHILPGVDHGSKSIEETLSQLDLIRGTTDRIVATSHFYPHVHSLDDFIAKVDRAAARLKEDPTVYDGVDICLGAEVLLCEFIDRFEGVERLCIRGTNCMLLEMPNVCAWSSRLIDTVENLLDNGFDIILAHIDRYMRDYQSDIDELLSMGAKAQINVSALTSFFSRKRLLPYIHSGAVCALGSDIHGADQGAYRTFSSIEGKIGADLYGNIMKRSEELLKNAELL